MKLYSNKKQIIDCICKNYLYNIKNVNPNNINNINNIYEQSINQLQKLIKEAYILLSDFDYKRVDILNSKMQLIYSYEVI